MIRVSNLIFRYTSLPEPSLRISDLSIPEGECLVLCGKSGSGKTSFTRLLNGLIPEYFEGEYSGDINIFGLVPGRDSIETFSKLTSTVFQNPASQFFYRKTEQELAFPCENQGLPSQSICERLNETAAFFHLQSLMDQDLLSASGGEQQRIALASSQMQSPKLLILDEPTANLDAEGVKMVRNYLSKLKAQGVTIVIAEHRLDYLENLGDRYLYFEKGEIAHCWSQEEWLDLTNEDRKKFGLRGLHLELKQFYEEDSCLLGVSTKRLQLRNNKVNLGQIADLHFPKNCITALVGLNGIGKSTLAKILSGIETSDGDVNFGKKTLSPSERLKQSAYVMQNVRLQLFSDSVRKEILLGNSKTADFKQVVEQLGLSQLLDRHPISLSGGEQQRVIIANALLSNKKIIIFDEPTSGLDYEQMLSFSKLLQELKSPERVIIVITHDLELINEACQQIRFIRKVP